MDVEPNSTGQSVLNALASPISQVCNTSGHGSNIQSLAGRHLQLAETPQPPRKQDTSGKKRRKNAYTLRFVV